ncbi:protein kinase C and casein kinase substrate in neurons protein 3-like isoform X2 [Trichomycterus rosablanca]|uniref:protein kinase C and casein kinase substrate in neurons protein 3-like isoform X2 n=1 Tax=Trichomycterus rosablanca TaxID=2290929 RepID=UPI002F35127F
MAEKKDDNLGFWTPGSYIRTVNRPQDSYKVCDVVVECLKDRARLEQRYAQQLNDWSNKWKKITDSRPMYGSVLRAWQCFFSSTERLSTLHSAVSHSLVSEDGGRIRSWQKKAFQKKAFYGFRESHDLKKEFARAQKPWVKRMKKLDKAEHVYHRACEKELKVLEKERQLRTNENQNQRALTKIQNSVEKAQHERERARERYVKVLDSVCSYTPRYMEEMEAVFDQSQEQEGKRIGFLKDTLLSIHSHLDITNNQSVKAVYSDLAHVLTVISEEDDLRWWRNHHGPGMITHWPTLQDDDRRGSSPSSVRLQR